MPTTSVRGCRPEPLIDAIAPQPEADMPIAMISAKKRTTSYTNHARFQVPERRVAPRFRRSDAALRLSSVEQDATAYAIARHDPLTAAGQSRAPGSPLRRRSHVSNGGALAVGVGGMPFAQAIQKVSAVASRLVLGGGAGANLGRIDGSD